MEKNPNDELNRKLAAIAKKQQQLKNQKKAVKGMYLKRRERKVRVTCWKLGSLVLARIRSDNRGEVESFLGPVPEEAWKQLVEAAEIHRDETKNQ